MPANKKLKILYVITKGNWGGAQRYVFDMATEAQKRGLEVVVAYGNPGELGKRLAEAGVRTIELGSLTRNVSLGADLASYRELSRVIQRERPDVLHLNSSKAGAMGALAGRMAGVPRIIFTAHGWALNESRPIWQKVPIWFIYLFTLLLVHRTIAVSRAVKRDADWMPFVSKKIQVIHNGIETPVFKRKEDARALLPEQNNKYWIGIIAELHPTKRINDAIDALGSVLKEFPHTILVVMGEGESRKKLEEQIAELGLQKNVFLLGFVADAAKYLQAFDMFLLPSRTEGLAYATIEAGFAGLPTIATRVGGLPEIIESEVSGILIPPQQPKALAEAIVRLLKNPDLSSSFGENLKRKVQREFSLGQMVDKTTALYLSAS